MLNGNDGGNEQTSAGENDVTVCGDWGGEWSELTEGGAME